MSAAQGRTLLIILDRIVDDALDIQRPEGIATRLWRSSLALIRSHGIGEQSAGKIYLGSSDRIRIAMLAAQLVKDVKMVSRRLTWKDFELFVSEIAERHNYIAIRNVSFKRPRVQIDVVAIKGSLCIVVDCKHWSTTPGESSLAEVARKQIIRAKIFLRSKQARQLQVKSVLPAIVTLLAGHSKLSVGVPVVPVSETNSFFASIDGFLDEYRLISRKNQE